MVKKQNKARKQPKRTRKNTRIARPSNPTFGAVSTINTAPVAIGNSMRGVKAQVIRSSNDSVRVIGRDFAQTAYNSGSATNWLPVAGFPVTPNCFVSSVLRNYCQMYNKFKFNKLRLHYITSSPTSSSGDVLFQVNAGRTDPLPNWTGANFLPYALSKPETVIGPQWTNHTMEIMPRGPTRNLDLGQNIDIDYQAQGEVFLYSKTSTTDSPGYLMIDYDITFSEMSINPKQGLLPNPLLLYQPIQLVWSTAALTANTTIPTLSIGSRGPGSSAITPITSSSSFKAGDLFKIAFDVTNTAISTWTQSSGTATAATVFEQSTTLGANAITLVDGYTAFVVINSASSAYVYSNMVDALSQQGAWRAGATFTPNTYGESAGVPNAGTWLYGYVSYVGNILSASMQQQ